MLNPLFGYTKGSVVEAALQVSKIQHFGFIALLGDWAKHLDLCLDRQRAKDANQACCLLPLYDLLYHRDIQVTFE